MKYKFFAILFLAVAGIQGAFAQNMQVGLELGLEVPVGDFSIGYAPGYCFGASGKYFLNEKMAVGGNLLYNSFHGYVFKDVYSYETWRNSAAATAFTGLFQYNFTDGKAKLYGGGDLGFYFWRSRYYYDYWINPAGHHSYEYRTWHETELGIAPFGGIAYDISDKLVFDGNIKLNLMLSQIGLNYLGFNVGLFYKFGGE